MRKNAGQIIRRYASALFESALEAGAVEPVSAQGEGLAQVFTPEVLSFFANPGISEQVKHETLAGVLEGAKAHAILINFLKLLLANKRFALAAEVLRDFQRRADAQLGIARVTLVTARGVDANEALEFERALSESLKKKVVLSRSVDASIKAGYVVKIGNTLVDASLKSRLQGLKESLSQGV
jgi:F-type H+-transporting ATPase subunit delta